MYLKKILKMQREEMVTTGNLENIKTLPRGAKIVRDLSVGAVQIGIPIETIKDSMDWSKGFPPKGVPQIMVVRDKLFDLENKCIGEELEFPVYYNFFLRNRKMKIACTAEQADHIREILKIAIFGKGFSKERIAQSYPAGFDPQAIPDLEKEFQIYARKNPKLAESRTLDDMVEFHIFDETSQQVTITANHEETQKPGEVRITRHGNDTFSVEDLVTQKVYTKIQAKPEIPRVKKTTQVDSRYIQLRNKITMVSSTSGFDVLDQINNQDHEFGSTVSFIIWDDLGNGTIVDPPPNMANWCLKKGIDISRIKNVVLTHYHADHDAGTKEFILTHKINLFTTETILEAFLEKTHHYTGLSKNQLLSCFNFYPVKLHTSIQISGFTYNFSHSTHPNETIRFTWSDHEDNKYYYSADILYSRKHLQEWVDEGLITAERMADIMAIPQDALVYIHEQGIAPIHTPAEAIALIDEYIRKKMYIVHTATHPKVGDKLIEHVRLATPETIIPLQTPREPNDDMATAHGMLGVLNKIPLFQNVPLTLSEMQDILTIFKKRSLAPHEPLMRYGELATKGYILMSGSANVLVPMEQIQKEHPNLNEKALAVFHEKNKEQFIDEPGIFIGESFVLKDGKRMADVVAGSQGMQVLEIDRDGLNQLERTKGVIAKMIKRTRLMREEGVPSYLSTIPVFETLTPRQVQQFIRTFNSYHFHSEASREFIKQGEKNEFVYILLEGTAEVVIHQEDGKTVLEKRVVTSDSSNIYGEISILTDSDARASVRVISALDKTRMIRTQKRNFIKFLRDNPDVNFKFQYVMKERLTETNRELNNMVAALIRQAEINEDLDESLE